MGDYGHFRKGSIDVVEGERCHGFHDALDGGGVERDVVGIASHEADVAAVGYDLNGIAGEEQALSARSRGPVENRCSCEVAATTNHGEAAEELLRFSFPELDAGLGTHDPAGVVMMQINGSIRESAAPFDHGCVVVRM